MPKNLCCCEQGGTFLAIPCRYYVIGRIDITTEDQVVFPQPPSGTPVVGPKRWGINSGDVFDTTRKIIFMMRGGGGGSNLAGKGGNAAYAEYVETASINLRARPARGGTGAQQLAVSSFPFAGGGIGYRQTAFGGGGSVIGRSSPLGQGNVTGVVGGGGGAGTDYDGGHGGSTFGFTGGGPSGGGGGSQSSGGIGGGGVLPPNASAATVGFRVRGGHGMRNQTTIIGYGGGGGGGYWGGGGGGLCSGGGGASSLRKPERTEFFIDGTDDGPGAGCNFHIANTVPWGLAGNRQTFGGLSNNSNNGNQGIVAYYYIDKYCVCDYPNEPEPPEKLFLCLSKEQRDTIIDGLGPQPDLNYHPIFELDGEKYHLLGRGLLGCGEICESAFRSNSTPTNMKWRLGEGFESPNANAPGGCCEYIQCTKVCDLSPCNTCECEDNKYYCCDIDDKPSVYWSIRGTSLYKCEKRGNGYIDFGKNPQALGYGTKLCMPITSTTNIENRCDEVDNDCTIELEPVEPSIFATYPSFNLRGEACDFEDGSYYCGFGLPRCYVNRPKSRNLNVSGTFDFVDGSGCFVVSDPTASSYLSGAKLCLRSEPDDLPPGTEAMVFEIEFFCDSQSNNNAIDIGETNPNEYKVCGATVFCPPPGTFLSNIAAALNSILGTSTVQVRAGAGYHSSELGAISEIERFPISNNIKRVTWKSPQTQQFVSGTFFGCQNFPIGEDLLAFVRRLCATFTLSKITLYDYLTRGPGALTVRSVAGEIGCFGVGRRECDDTLGADVCAVQNGCDCYRGGGSGQVPFGSGGNCQITCTTNSNNWSLSLS